MKREIRKKVREFIINDVNTTIASLGVSERIQETEVYNDEYYDTHYQFESSPIRQVPMMFKELAVSGEMKVITLRPDSPLFCLSKNNDIIYVSLYYRYKYFGGSDRARNAKIGSIIYAVDKDIPKSFEDIVLGNFVRKVKDIKI